MLSNSFEQEQMKSVDRGPPRLIKKSVKRKLLDEGKDFVEVGSDSEEEEDIEEDISWISSNSLLQFCLTCTSHLTYISTCRHQKEVGGNIRWRML